MLEFYVRVLHGTVADVAGAEGKADSEKSDDAGPGTSNMSGTVLPTRSGFQLVLLSVRTDAERMYHILCSAQS